MEETNPQVPPNTLQVHFEIDEMCQGKGLYLSIEVEGLPNKMIKIAKEGTKIEYIEIPP